MLSIRNKVGLISLADLHLYILIKQSGNYIHNLLEIFKSFAFCSATYIILKTVIIYLNKIR